MKFLAFRRHPVRQSDLSAYLDARLPESQQRRVEAHVESCAGCRRALEEMREVVAELRALPVATAPRSFALTPELAAVTRRAATAGVEKERTAVRRAYLGFSGATVAAALLFVALFGAELVAISGRGAGPASTRDTTATTAGAESAAALPAPAVAAPTDATAKRLDTETGEADQYAASPAGPTAVPENGALAPSNPPSAATIVSPGEAAMAQAVQPAEKGSSHVWLWVLEGAAGGLVIGFGASAFWTRRRWNQINRDS